MRVNSLSLFLFSLIIINEAYIIMALFLKNPNQLEFDQKLELELGKKANKNIWENLNTNTINKKNNNLECIIFINLFIYF